MANQKVNPYRFNIQFDPQDPLQKRAAEILNKVRKTRQFGRYISEIMVLAMQTPESGMDWLKMQTGFLSGGEPVDAFAAMSSNGSEKAGPKKSVESYAVPIKAEAPQSDDSSVVEEEPEFAITIDEGSESEADLDFFMREMDAFKLG